MNREELIDRVKDLHEQIFETLDDAIDTFANRLNVNCRLVFSYNNRLKNEESMGNAIDDIELSILSKDNLQYFEEAEVNSFEERLEYLTSTQLEKFIKEFQEIIELIQSDVKTLADYDKSVDELLEDKRDGNIEFNCILFWYTI